MKHSILASGLATGLSLLVLGTTAVHADTICSGIIGGTHDNVIVDGTSCTLNGAFVNGNIIVSNGGTLDTTRNGAEVLGAVQVDGGGDISFDASTLYSGVALNQSGNLSISGSTVVGVVSITSSGEVILESGASVSGIQNLGSLGVSLSDASVPGGISMTLANGSLVACGAAIGGSGIFMSQTNGSMIMQGGAKGCASSEVDDGSISVQKGTGDVLIAGAVLFDLIVLDQVGDVVISDTRFMTGAPLSDFSVTRLTGNVSVDGITTDSDVTVTESTGSVTITGSGLGGDAIISSNGGVTVTKSSFALEDVSITGNTGPILVDRNCDLNLTVLENNNVTISNNSEAAAGKAKVDCNLDGFGLTNVIVDKNTGGVSIVKNTGELLSCADNDPAPTGSGNSFTITNGQCAGF